MPDYHSPDGPPEFKPVDCNNIFEVLFDRVDKPLEYTHIIAELLCKATNPTQNIVFVDGVPMIYDPTRGKTLSIDREVIRAGDFGKGVTNRSLSMDDVPSAGSQGYPVPRPATITGLWAKSRSTSAWIFEVRRNGAAITLANLNVSGGIAYDANLDIDINIGDTLQIFASGTNIQHPIACVEIAWRQP